MKSRKKILVLISGVITALLLIVNIYLESGNKTSFSERQKPPFSTPALNLGFIF